MNMNKIADYVFPVGGGASGGLLSFITFTDFIQWGLSAAIFALVGGIVGYFVKIMLDRIFKKNE